MARWRTTTESATTESRIPTDMRRLGDQLSAPPDCAECAGTAILITMCRNPVIESGQTLASIHDRNPVILPQRMRQHWIDPTVAGDQALVDEAVRAGVAEATSLRFDQVGSVRGDGPELIEPVA